MVLHSDSAGKLFSLAYARETTLRVIAFSRLWTFRSSATVPVWVSGNKSGKPWRHVSDNDDVFDAHSARLVQLPTASGAACARLFCESFARDIEVPLFARSRESQTRTIRKEDALMDCTGKVRIQDNLSVFWFFYHSCRKYFFEIFQRGLVQLPSKAATEFLLIPWPYGDFNI